MNLADYVRGLVDKTNKVCEGTLDDAELMAGLGPAMSAISDFEKCFSLVSSRKEGEIFGYFLKEYSYAYFSLFLGLYRQAFISLRLSFELFLSAVDFSTDEVRLRKWKRGEVDIRWASLIDENSGVLSKSFVKVMYEPLSEDAKQFRAIAEKVYRECSEYVHGNLHTHESLGGELAFSKDVVSCWLEKAETIRLVALFAFASRYFDQLDGPERAIVEPVYMAYFSHMRAVREYFGGAVGG